MDEPIAFFTVSIVINGELTLVNVNLPLTATDMYDNHANAQRLAAQAVDHAFRKLLK